MRLILTTILALVVSVHLSACSTVVRTHYSGPLVIEPWRMVAEPNCADINPREGRWCWHCFDGPADRANRAYPAVCTTSALTTWTWTVTKESR